MNVLPLDDATKRGRGWVEGADDLRLWRVPQSWDEALQHAERVLAVAKKEAPFSTKWVLFSGGNDSLVLLHVIAKTLGWPIDGVVHVNTGIGIPETNAFARATVEEWGLNFIELHPPRSYEQVFIEDRIINGLPGPGMHRIAYARLKERPVAAFVQSVKRSYWDRVILLTGIRHSESQRRMGYGEKLVNRERAQVWANPIYYVSDALMKAYRAEHALPVNPVSEHLHMSGECLCGSFAHPGELDEIGFFYPEVAARIRGIEEQAEAAGLTYCKWGARRGENDTAGPMCSSCDARLFDDEAVS